MMAVMMTMIILIIAVIISAVIAIAINYSVPDLETGCTRGEPEHKGAAAALSRCWGWGGRVGLCLCLGATGQCRASEYDG